MKLLTDKHLFERELGNYMFSVPALLQWASSKGYVLRTNPELAGFDMAQVECVLSAIEAAARPARDDALEMVAAIPRLAGHRMAGDPTLSAWLIGADAVRQWREIFTKAIDNGELQIFDAVSLLPVSWSLRSGSPEKAAPARSSDGNAGHGDVATTAETPAERRAKHDMAKERGCRLAILTNWDTIEKSRGPNAAGPQVLRELNRKKDPAEKSPSLKTVQNRLIELRKENLIPG